VELIWRRGSKGLQRGRFLRLWVRPAGATTRRLARAAGEELPVCWLLAEWPVGGRSALQHRLAVAVPAKVAAGERHRQQRPGHDHHPDR
jgi:hypothetical protein